MKISLACALGILSLSLLACGDDSADGGDGECTPDQISVYQPGSDTPDCHPIPAECGGTAACADQPCAAAMYAYCSGANVGCSDLEGESTLITCN